MRSVMKWLCFAPTVVAVSALAGPALAQQGTTGPVARAEPAVSSSDEIIVTAQKREQNLQDVPISMTVISGEQIADFHSTDLHSLQNSIPNLYIERLNFADTIYLRGFGTGPAVFAFDPSVSMYVDGVYSGRPQQFSSPFFDVDRVEVLRGPQGALFGKNTAAGAVSIVTAGPTSVFDAAATVSYDVEHKGKEVSGHVSGPLSDALSMRVSARYADTDGYVPNRVSGEDNPRREEVLGRLAIRYEAGEFDVTAKVQYAETDGKGENQVLASLATPGVVSEDQFTDPNPFGFENACKRRLGPTSRPEG